MSISLCHDCSATQVVIFQEASYFIPRRLSTSVYRLSLYVLAGRFWDIVPFVKPIPLTCVNAIKRGTFASKRRYRTTLNGHRVVYPPPPLNTLIVSITFGLRPPTFHRYFDNSLRVRDTLLERIIRELDELRILRIEFRVSSKFESSTNRTSTYSKNHRFNIEAILIVRFFLFFGNNAVC